MKERNIILEGKLKSWLLSVDIEKLAAKQQGQLILGLEKLYQATGDADYHTFAKKAVDNLVAEDGTYARQRAAFPIIYLAMRYLQYVQWILYTIRRTQQLKRQKKPF